MKCLNTMTSGQTSIMVVGSLLSFTGFQLSHFKDFTGLSGREHSSLIYLHGSFHAKMTPPQAGLLIAFYSGCHYKMYPI